MYENETYLKILSDARNEIDTSVQTDEGSLVYAACSALAYEIEKLYVQLDYIVQQSHADTADYENLTKICANRAIFPKMATSAVVSIQCNVAVPIGTRFSLKGYNYKVTELLDDAQHLYKTEVEETGAGPNGLKGELIPIDYVDGLENAEIKEVLIEGEDDETKEHLYQRYISSFTSASFAGNISAYKEAVNSYAGIGGCKVYPAWNGAGTVKVVMISSAFGTVSDYLLGTIRKEADPTNTADGYGFVPIGHTATFESVKEVLVAVTTKITYSDGYSWETIGDSIKDAISGYLKSIAEAWADGDENTLPIVYISRLESAVLDVDGVLDISGTTLNGKASNLQLESDQIPTMGEVTTS